MAYRKQFDMKQPLRAAPPPPMAANAKKQPDRWADDLFADGPFSPSSGQSSLANQKKKPPPRPPPPDFSRLTTTKPDVPQRPAHFNRKPTVLSSLMSRKNKPARPIYDFHQNICPPPDTDRNADTGVAIASLIDLSSPPSSPTLTARSSSDGLSVDSFGSDVTSSTANVNFNGGNSSQAESGFEDDYDLFSSGKTPVGETDTPDSWASFDPFSPPKNSAVRVNVTRPVYDSDFLDPLCNGKTVATKVQTHRIPTIIRAKPARPKAPKNSALLTTTLVNGDGRRLYSDPISTVRTPYQTVDDLYNEGNDMPDEGSYSPPMPSVPPPPPPPTATDECQPQQFQEWNSGNVPIDLDEQESVDMNEEPYGIALYDFPGTQDDDLPFRANDKIRLLRQLNEEWLYGRVRCGLEGMFPANFIEVKVPLKESKVKESGPADSRYPVMVLYDFVPQQDGDLGLSVGSKVYVTAKMNEEWLYGEVNGLKGQFPANYVDHVPDGLPIKPSL